MHRNHRSASTGSTDHDQTESLITIHRITHVEISEELAALRQVVNGGWVRVWSKRGSVKAKAVVTKRIRPLNCDGKVVHVVGIPLHWGFTGSAKKGFGPNSLSPFVGEASIETPEYKTFLVNLEPTTAPGVQS
ncbi:molybdopterin dinucleotide binding domain-containing protein [Roseomonas chloroacetimidivorans]|uniref:molybdopterin dinucleotide binding domain-containing protein n=1 Tax=Roseomonas chloroacetimidivorans TaxID=1766656 RepID=UPI003C76CCD5